MAITNAQQARQLYNEGGPMKKIKGQDHMLAYITPNEADKLVKLGGQETMTPEGILAYPEFDNYTEVGGGTRSQFESSGYQGTGNAGDGVIQQYNTQKSTQKAPLKKPPKTKENFKKSNRFTTPTAAVAGAVAGGIKNSRLGRYLNTKARTNYLNNLQITNPELYQETIDDLEKLGYYNSDPVEYFGPKGKQEGPMAPARDIEKFSDLFEDQAKSILNTVRNNPDGSIGTLYDDYLDSRKIPDNSGDGSQDPCKGPNPPAYCFVGNNTTIEEQVVPTRNLGGLAPRFAGSIFDFTGLADGGRAGMMDGGMMEDTPEGGIMDLESGRQMYFLGKLVKKATRAVKKIVKSPIGKAALIGGLGYLGATKMGGMKGLTNFFGKGSFNPLKALITTSGADGAAQGLGLSKLGMIANKFGLATGTGALTGLGKAASFGIPAALSYFMTPKEDDDNEFDIDDYYKTNSLNIADIRNRPYDFLAPRIAGSRFNVADGGRIDYAEGSEEPVAKKTMPLLDMDGQEMDLREEGGFVPLGRMERADDVPARLSKNEFVFTADAVRNAGEGDVDKGAEVMYNMMKNLESGGDVSQESQGLEGAREMFKTSQRLEEVI